MARITIAELSKAIRASVDDPTGNVLADVTRLHGLGDATILRYAPNVPEAVYNSAMVAFAQYLYDLPNNELRGPHNAFVSSGAKSMVAPYRQHRIGIDGAAGAAGAALDREAVIEIMREVLAPFAFTDAGAVLPDQAFIDARIGARVDSWATQGSDEFVPDDKINPAIARDSEIGPAIDMQIPPSRRVPEYAVGDAGQYLGVNAQGNALHFSPVAAGGAIDKASVYAQLQSIVQAGHRVTLTPNDDDSELTIAVDDVPAGVAFPATGPVGERFRLLADTSIHNDALLDIVEGTETPTPTTVTVSFGSGFPTLQSYAPNYSGSGSSTLAGKTFLVYAGAPSDLATNVICYAPGASRATYPANQSAVGGSYPHWYEVPSLGIAVLRLLSAQAGVDSQEDARFNLDFASGAQRYADSEFEPGDYTRSGLANHWELTPGIAAPWATQGQPEPRTLLAITQLIDGAGIGMTVNNAGANAFSPNTGLNFDLDDADHQHGIIECEVTLRFTARSANTIGFSTDGANQVIEKRITGFVFASTVRALPDFVVNSLTAITEVADVSIYDGSTGLGVVSLNLTKDSNNVMGYLLHFDSELVAGSRNFTLSASLDIAFLHNDGPASTSVVYETVFEYGDAESNNNAIRDALLDATVKGYWFSIPDPNNNMEGSVIMFPDFPTLQSGARTLRFKLPNMPAAVQVARLSNGQGWIGPSSAVSAGTRFGTIK